MLHLWRLGDVISCDLSCAQEARTFPALPHASVQMVAITSKHCRAHVTSTASSGRRSERRSSPLASRKGNCSRVNEVPAFAFDFLSTARPVPALPRGRTQFGPH
ncbi:conserved hypothetical protein [Ricinus communis]|uniref:Uncharacterized protein n=1 Tax=Ricinus communis TaxID=3988 RepID=B9TGL9_RICCO|nr:conserved hypothetical protein [Ricinus communis]